MILTSGVSNKPPLSANRLCGQTMMRAESTFSYTERILSIILFSLFFRLYQAFLRQRRAEETFFQCLSLRLLLRTALVQPAPPRQAHRLYKTTSAIHGRRMKTMRIRPGKMPDPSERRDSSTHTDGQPFSGCLQQLHRICKQPTCKYARICFPSPCPVTCQHCRRTVYTVQAVFSSPVWTFSSVRNHGT